MANNNIQQERGWVNYRTEFWVGVMVSLMGFLYDVYSNAGFTNINSIKVGAILALFIIGVVLVRLIKNLINTQVKSLIDQNHSLLTDRLDKLEKEVPENLKDQLDSFSKEEDLKSLKNRVEKIEEANKSTEKYKENEEVRRSDLLRILIDLHVRQVKFNKYMRSGSYESADLENSEVDKLLNELRAHKKDDIVRKIIAKRILDE